MRVVAAVLATAAVVMLAARERHNAHLVMMLRRVLLGMRRCALPRFGHCGNAFHRDGRIRLNRKAQYQQHDDE